MILNHGHVGVGVSLLLFGIGAVGVVFLTSHCTFAKFFVWYWGWCWVFIKLGKKVRRGTFLLFGVWWCFGAILYRVWRIGRNFV
jgi:hypothetical protein